MRRAVVIALLILVSCKSQQSKEDKAREQLASWAATGQMLSSSWARGAAMKPYAKSTVQVASDEVDKLRKPLQDDSKSMRSVDDVSKLYEQLSEAIENDDRGAGGEISRAFAQISSKLQKEKDESQSS